MSKTIDALRSQLLAQESVLLHTRATAAQRIAQLEHELSARGISVPSPLPAPLLTPSLGTGTNGGALFPGVGAAPTMHGGHALHASAPPKSSSAAVADADAPIDHAQSRLPFLGTGDSTIAGALPRLAGGSSGSGDSSPPAAAVGGAGAAQAPLQQQQQASTAQLTHTQPPPRPQSDGNLHPVSHPKEGGGAPYLPPPSLMLPLQPHQVQPFSIPLLQAPHGPFPPAYAPGPPGVHYAGSALHMLQQQLLQQHAQQQQQQQPHTAYHASLPQQPTQAPYLQQQQQQPSFASHASGFHPAGAPGLPVPPGLQALGSALTRSGW